MQAVSIRSPLFTIILLLYCLPAKCFRCAGDVSRLAEHKGVNGEERKGRNRNREKNSVAKRENEPASAHVFLEKRDCLMITVAKGNKR